MTEFSYNFKLSEKQYNETCKNVAKKYLNQKFSN